jgi:cobalt-zinc-cadmium efflux system protein
MVVEVIGGLASGSLALLADAGHMLSDSSSISLALVALWLSSKPPGAVKSFGYHRAEILATLANAASLLLVAVFVVVEAIKRLTARETHEIDGPVLLIVAIGGLLVNVIALKILSKGKRSSMNVHGAWLHVFGDLLGSIGAITAGVLAWAFDLYWTDAVISVLIALLILVSSWGLMKRSVSVLMESAPVGVDVDKVSSLLSEIPGVQSLHDLHVWALTERIVAASAHVVVDDGVDAGALLVQMRHALLHMGVHHATLQVEAVTGRTCVCAIDPVRLQSEHGLVCAEPHVTGEADVLQEVLGIPASTVPDVPSLAIVDKSTTSTARVVEE